MNEKQYIKNPEPLLHALARLFASDGAAIEVALLTYSLPEIGEAYYDNWNGGTDFYQIILHVPMKLFTQVESKIEEIETSLSMTQIHQNRLVRLSSGQQSLMIQNGGQMLKHGYLVKG